MSRRTLDSKNLLEAPRVEGRQRMFRDVRRSSPTHFPLIVHLYNTCIPLPPPQLPCLFAAV